MLLCRGDTLRMADGILGDGFAVGEDDHSEHAAHASTRDRYVASAAALSAVNERLGAAHLRAAEMGV
jgi:hypothetical protein